MDDVLELISQHRGAGLLVEEQDLEIQANAAWFALGSRLVRSHGGRVSRELR
jgi:hypothetical protein